MHEPCGRVCTFVRVTEGTMCTICPYVMCCSPYGAQCHAFINFWDGGCDRNFKSRIYIHVAYHTVKNERLNRD